MPRLNKSNLIKKITEYYNYSFSFSRTTFITSTTSTTSDSSSVNFLTSWSFVSQCTSLIVFLNTVFCSMDFVFGRITGIFLDNNT